ncbi:MAG: lysophospholipid acyltransferase family protein [Balneolaceae bacterium]
MFLKFYAAFRLFAITIYTGVTFGIYASGLLVVKVTGIRYEPWRNLFMRVWAKGVVVIFNIKIIAAGKPPEPPFFIVSNHLSYLDIVPLYISMKCTFVAKKEVRSWPLLGTMVHAVGVIFVDRTKQRDVSRVNKLLSESLNHYQGLVLFPEGTSSGGQEVLPFHSSLLELPAAGNIPVHTVSLYYETGKKDLPAIDSVCFFGARESFLSHVFKLAQTRKIVCKIRFGDEPVQSGNRKKLAAKLHEKVKELFEPTAPKSGQVYREETI